MTVPSLWWNAARVDLAYPTIALSIKHAQVAVILLAVIATEDVEFFVK